LDWNEKGFIAEAAALRGQPAPSWLEDEPFLAPGEDFYLGAFWELSTCRAMGMSIGPIPWDKVVDYARFAGLDYDNLGLFVMVIRAMDSVYLEWLSKKAENK